MPPVTYRWLKRTFWRFTRLLRKSLSSWTTAVFVFVSLVFSGGAALGVSKWYDATEMLASAQRSHTWAASQLYAEYHLFLDTLNRFSDQRVAKEKLQLQFDIFWSRVEVLSLGAETAEIRKSPEALTLLANLQSTLVEMEPLVWGLSYNDKATKEAIFQKFQSYGKPLKDLIYLSFHELGVGNKLYQFVRTQKTISYLFVGMIISGVVLMVLLFHQNLRNKYHAHHDDLTGLPNRKGLMAYLDKQMSNGHGDNFAIHLLDLNKFKDINDTMGHAAGDALLVDVADRIRSVVPRKYMVGRMGGDEFVVIQLGEVDRHSAECLATTLISAIGKGSHSADIGLVSASLGIAFYPNDTTDATQLLISADMAMYKAKGLGGKGYCFYEPNMGDSLIRNRTLAEDLYDAILQNELYLLYQPIVSLTSGEVVCVEALLRWNHSDFGPISPLESISVAEYNGLGRLLGEWVLTTACKDLSFWRESLLCDVSVSVNFSPSMYLSEGLLEIVDDTLKKHALPHSALVIEVTEDIAMHEMPDLLETLHSLKDKGIRLALDDFGTGYSSLSQLQGLPIHKIKIDKSFVQTMHEMPGHRSLVLAMISVAKSMGIKIIAEGIEEYRQLEFLRKEGCDEGQGYLFSKPIPSDDILQMVQSTQTEIGRFSAK